MIVCTYLFIYVFIYQAERSPIFWVMSTSEEFSEFEGSKPVIFNHYLTLVPPFLFLHIKASFHRFRSPGSIASEAFFVPVAFSISCKIEQATVGKMLCSGPEIQRKQTSSRKRKSTRKRPPLPHQMVAVNHAYYRTITVRLWSLFLKAHNLLPQTALFPY